MKGFLKCLGMLVKKKKKKERLFLSLCEIKEPELLFQKISIKCGTAMFTSIDRNCLEF